MSLSDRQLLEIIIILGDIYSSTQQGYDILLLFPITVAIADGSESPESTKFRN